MIDEKKILVDFSDHYKLFFERHPKIAMHTFPVFRETLSDFSNRIRTKEKGYLSSVSYQLQAIESVLIPTGSTPKEDTDNEQAERSLQVLAQNLRLKKDIELARIATADLLAIDDFSTTVGKISSLADAIVVAAFEALSGKSFGLSIIAMGKLGGRELNYSSDIDLIFCSEKSLDHQQSKEASRFVQKFIALLSEATAQGHAYRVDLKIRPYGDAGALHLSHSALEDYYLKKASLWEWQALLKARVIVGDKSAEKLVDDLQQKCIFQNEIPFSTLVLNIKEMKMAIEKTVRDKQWKMDNQELQSARFADCRNVKLGPGGIRDIEFIVQFLQFYHSSFSNPLKSASTLSAILLLQRRGIVTNNEGQLLRKNYIFLREVEHLLQLQTMLSAHSLPADDSSLAVISNLMENKVLWKKAREKETERDSSFLPSKPVLSSVNQHPTQTAENFLRQYNTIVIENRAQFEELFNHSEAMLKKLSALRKAIPADMQKVLNQHFHRLESDYFLSFKNDQIAKHLKRLCSFTAKQRCDVHFEHGLKHTSELDNKDETNGTLEIITEDLFGMFSTLCGLAASHGFNILHGSSHVYTKSVGMKRRHLERRSFQRRQSVRRWQSDTTQTAKHNDKRRFQRRQVPERRQLFNDDVKQKKRPFDRVLICHMQGKFISSAYHSRFDGKQVQVEIENYIRAVKVNEEEKATEKILFNVVSLQNSIETPRVTPPEIEVDNESDPSATILRLHGIDYFMFLYFFTSTIAHRNFNFLKLKFSTQKDRVQNIFFVTERNGKKIKKDERLQELKTTALVVNFFTAILPHAPSPAVAFRLFNKNVFTSADYEQLFNNLLSNDVLSQQLGKMFGSSENLFEDFLRDQSRDLLSYFLNKKELNFIHSKKYLLDVWKEMENSLAKAVDLPDDGETLNIKKIENELNALNRFKNDMLFEVDLRLLSGKCESFASFCFEISNIADVVFSMALKLACKLAVASLTVKPSFDVSSCFAVLALGKWGGREMGYASDLEMMVVYDVEEDKKSEAKKFYAKTLEVLMKHMPCKRHGIFELDLRLRPDAEASSLGVAIERFRSYYSFSENTLSRAKNFERMALVKLRIIDAPEKLRKEIVDAQLRFVYSKQKFSFSEYQHLRKRQAKELVKPGEINLKYSNGGLVDIEYLVQALQISHGATVLEIRNANTEKALKALAETQLLPAGVAMQLLADYHFLRKTINCLRLVRGDARDLVLPRESSLEYRYFTRRMHSFAVLAQGFENDKNAGNKSLFLEEKIEQDAQRVHLMISTVMRRIRSLNSQEIERLQNETDRL